MRKSGGVFGEFLFALYEPSRKLVNSLEESTNSLGELANLGREPPDSERKPPDSSEELVISRRKSGGFPEELSGFAEDSPYV